MWLMLICFVFTDRSHSYCRYCGLAYAEVGVVHPLARSGESGRDDTSTAGSSNAME